MTPGAQLFRHIADDVPKNPPNLPPLPRSIRYWDDFNECSRTLVEVETATRIEIHDDGTVTTLNLAGYSPFQRKAVLHIIAHQIGRNDVTTVSEWVNSFKTIYRRSPAELLEYFAALQPFDLRRVWETNIFPDLTQNRQARCLKKILHVFCDLRVGGWGPEFKSIVSILSAPKEDVFAVVRSGECFIPVQHQKILYEFLDDLAAKAASGANVNWQTLRDAVAVLLADQHGLRPGAIARIKATDVRFHDNGAVHISVIMIKKHDGSRRIRVTRRVKREWCPIVRAFADARPTTATATAAGNRFLRLTPFQVTKAIAGLMLMLTGEKWTATDLRHTAAQRMVDSGASADQLAEFMLHNNTLVGNLYFDQSPTQASRINQALAISPIYSELPEIHRTKTIDKAALMGVPEENQVGGAPHGIPIAGIGACQLGQSACQKNPVLSCYGCNKFLAVGDPEVHEGVVESLRPVVLEFHEAGRGLDRSPAYAQLQRTLTTALAIANDIRAGTIE